MQPRVLRILWPAFLVAGVLEMLVFAVVDPGELRWFGGRAIDWAPIAIYSFTFLVFWAAVAAAGVLTSMLALTADEVNRQAAAGVGRSFAGVEVRPVVGERIEGGAGPRAPPAS